MGKHTPCITVVGSLNMDIVVEATRSPEEGETILGEQVHFIPGGKGANQAVAAARLGAETQMIGTVGKDEFGHSLLQALKEEGVNTSGVKQVADIHSGVASILLAQKDNRIIVVPGANQQCLPTDIDHHHTQIQKAEIVLLQLEIPLSTVEQAVRIANQANKQVVLNPAPAHKLTDHLLSQVDYITPNRSELSGLTGIQIRDDQDLARAMSALLDRGPSHVVTTLGNEGAAYMDQKRYCHKVKGRDVPVVDTTGAGDSFNAAFAYAIAKQQSLDEAVAFAIKVSSIKVTKLGAQAGMPTLDEVLQTP